MIIPLTFNANKSVVSFFQAVMKLLTNPHGGDGAPRPGVMIPTPQYPLYSASLAEYNLDQVCLYLQIVQFILGLFVRV